MRDKPGKNSDAWLEDESTVSRAYDELKQPGPPAHLDQEILAEARRAVASPENVVIRVQRWRKWTMPAALAATVVFAVPLVVRVFTSEQLYTPGDQTAAVIEAQDRALEVELAQAQRKAMELDLVDSDTDLAELTSPESRILAEMPLAANESRSPPQPAIASERPEPFPPEVRGETSRTDFDEIVMAEPALADAGTGKPAPPSFSDDTAGPATDEIFAAAPSSVDDSVARSNSDETQVSPMAGAVVAQSPPDESRRAKAANATAPAAADRASAARTRRTSADGDTREETNYRAGRLASAIRDLEKEAGDEQDLLSDIAVLDPEPWLTDIADLHRRGLVRTARRELGYFLQTYPDYSLPVKYPLQAADAIFDDDNTEAKTGDIVPEAGSWLRGIGMMAERGDIDQARTQLAEFFAIYPDYPLPVNFPLTREDAEPIER